MTHAARPPLSIRTIADRDATAPKRWVVAGLLAAGEVSGLVAPPSTGKSALAADLAASIASGEQWFGRKVAAGAALYIAAERAAVTLRRLKAFATYHEIAALDVGVISGRIDLLRDAEDAERIVQAARAYEERAQSPVRLITIDTARAVMPAGDENSPKDMGLLARHLGVIRDNVPEAHVQILHHTPKGRPSEASGHTALAAMLDTIMVLSTGPGERRSWHVAEANDLASLPPREPFELQSMTIGRDGDGEPITAPMVRPIDQNQKSSAGKPATLPPDVSTALSVLQALERSDQPVTCDRWSDAIRAALGPGKGGRERTTAAKRQAASDARKRLLDVGLVQQIGEIVSVRIASG